MLLVAFIVIRVMHFLGCAIATRLLLVCLPDYKYSISDNNHVVHY